MSKTTNRFSPEVRARAVRLGFGSREGASIAVGGGFLEVQKILRLITCADCNLAHAGHVFRLKEAVSLFLELLTSKKKRGYRPSPTSRCPEAAPPD